MTIGRLIKKYAAITAAWLAFIVLASLLHASPAAAAGETYTWKDYQTISITGGNTIQDQKMQQFPQLNRAVMTVDQGDPSLTGDQIGKFFATAYVNMGGHQCWFPFTIIIYKGNTQGQVWAPPPYTSPIGTAPQGYPPDCRQFPDIFNQLAASFHNHYIAIGGTRPTNTNVPERPDQQTFQVIVNAPDPQSTAPKTDTVYVYTADGKTQVTSATGPFTPNIQAGVFPPDQTPVSALITIQGLQPGNYIVCDTYVAKNCTDPTKLIAGQKITKVKYDGTGGTTIGTLFLSPDQKRIRGHVEFHVTAGCGAAVSVSPVTITLTGPGGKTYDQQTNSGSLAADPSKQGHISCTVDVAFGLYAQWDNMPPGVYKACTALAAACVTFTKPPDAGVDDFTLVVNGPKQAPADQKVCTSGDGIAGALAWIICPAVQMIASATDFFENNIIIPFMTVSPLTTNGANPIYILWQDFRDLANVGFIILLFISIFSIALSKYGLKRVMPRLLIVAIGINLSYFVVAFAVDAFNIFGGGISQFIMAALNQAGTQQLNGGTSAGPVRSLFTLGGAALLTVVLSGGAALGWLFSFLGLAALVVLIVVAVLIIRQIALIVLVVLAPVAILMYLLPNTENYFRKWRQTLIQLLLMYPMIVLLFAAGKVLGVILQQPDFKIAGDGVSDEVAQAVRIILQFLVYVIPLVFLPATFAASGNLMSRAYRIANNGRLRKAVQQPGKSFQENVVKPRRQELQMRAARRGGAIGWAAGYGYRRDNRRRLREQELARARNEYVAQQVLGSERERLRAAGVGGEQGAGRAGLSAQNVLLKMESEDLKAAMTDLERVVMAQNGALDDITGAKLSTDEALMAMARGKTIRSIDGSRTYDGSTQIYRDGAMNLLSKNGRAKQVRTLLEEYQAASDQANETLLRNAIKKNGNSLVGKAPDLVKGEKAAFTDATGEAMAGYHSSTVRTQLRYMQREYDRSVDMSLTAPQRKAAQDNFDQATTSFNASLASIASSATMGAKFSGEAGREALAASTLGGTNAVITNPAVRAAIATGLGRIDPVTGKVT